MILSSTYSLNWIDTNSPFYQQALSLRYQLFFAEHELSKQILFDAQESHSSHLAAICQNTLVAYGRLSEIGNNTAQISQMVVCPKHQRRGLGSAIVDRLVEEARVLGATKVVLNARLDAINLYKKSHFLTTGEIYPSSSTGVPHIKMTLDITKAE